MGRKNSKYTSTQCRLRLVHELSSALAKCDRIKRERVNKRLEKWARVKMLGEDEARKGSEYVSQDKRAAAAELVRDG